MTDDAIVVSVKAALASKPDLKASDLKTATKNGEVTIAGPVENARQLYNIADTAQKVAGVKSVFNDMYIKNQFSVRLGPISICPNQPALTFDTQFDDT